MGWLLLDGLFLKERLFQAPILPYPKFGPSAAPLYLLTDASAMGVGALLEQEGHVTAYISRSLTPSERNYSVIQWDCLAVVYSTKQFCHNLLEQPFTLHMDYAPLQWLNHTVQESSERSFWQC